jgi:hypothetical protein
MKNVTTWREWELLLTEDSTREASSTTFSFYNKVNVSVVYGNRTQACMLAVLAITKF